MLDKLKRIGTNASKLSLSTPNNRGAMFTLVVSKKEIQKLIIDLNRVEQLFKKGIDESGKVIGTYSDTTEELSENKSFSFGGFNKTKKAGQPYMLFDTGFFYKSFRVRIYNDGFTITANDEKDNGQMLAEIYGIEILGLTKKSRDVLIKAIKPQIISETRKQIFR